MDSIKTRLGAIVLFLALIASCQLTQEAPQKILDENPDFRNDSWLNGKTLFFESKILVQTETRRESFSLELFVSTNEAFLTLSKALIGDLIQLYSDDRGYVRVYDVSENRFVEADRLVGLESFLIPPRDLITAVLGKYPKQNWYDTVFDKNEILRVGTYKNNASKVAYVSEREIDGISALKIPKRITLKKSNDSILIVQKNWKIQPAKTLLPEHFTNSNL